MRRHAITLIEMLVALAVTLIMMGAVVSIFSWIGSSVSDSRASIELAERLRATRNQLQLDLQGVTATMDPPRRPESDEGYFQYCEGPILDSYFSKVVAGAHVPNSIMGDYDDVLKFTTRSVREPFVGKGKVGGVVRTIESQTAEVVWYARASRSIATTDPAKPIQLFNLCRRVLLIYPNADPVPEKTEFVELNVSGGWRHDAAGVSIADASGANLKFPNTLGDLTKRFARYTNQVGGMSFGSEELERLRPPSSIHSDWVPFYYDEPRYRDDIVLDNVLAFNVRAYDPGAPVYVDMTPSPPMTVVPGDLNYETMTGPPSAYGAYVDLDYKLPTGFVPLPNTPLAQFTVPRPTVYSWITNPPLPMYLEIPCYDTWSLHYEADGIDENKNGLIDEGTNGLDDDSNGAVDDAGEFETQCPYPFRLRGVQIKIRVYEPDSRQVREVTVVEDFLPQ